MYVLYIVKRMVFRISFKIHGTRILRKYTQGGGY